MAEEIKKINPHYSMTTPASIHDEEALTALQLAGRLGAKLNEVIEAVNEFVEYYETVTRDIPQYVADEVSYHIEVGKLKHVLKQYTAQLEARLDSVLGTPIEGAFLNEMLSDFSITHLGEDTNYPPKGVRASIQRIYDSPLPDEMLYALFNKTDNLFNPRNVTLNLGLDGAAREIVNMTGFYHTTGFIDLYPLPSTITDVTSLWFKQTTDGKTVSFAQVRSVNFYDENFAHIPVPVGTNENVDYILVNDFPESARYIRVTFDQNYMLSTTQFGIGYKYDACLQKHYAIRKTNANGWKDKTILVYGDSQVGQEKWQSYVENALGCKIISYGLAGYPLLAVNASNPGYALSSTEQYSKIINSGIVTSKVDAVIIVGGTNDIAQGVTNVNLKMGEGIINFLNFKGNLMTNEFCDISTPFIFTEPFYAGEGGLKAGDLESFNNALKTSCDYYGFQVVEAGVLKQLNTTPQYYNNDSEFDGVHLTATTAPIFANNVINALAQIAPYV